MKVWAAALTLLAGAAAAEMPPDLAGEWNCERVTSVPGASRHVERFRMQLTLEGLAFGEGAVVWGLRREPFRFAGQWSLDPDGRFFLTAEGFSFTAMTTWPGEMWDRVRAEDGTSTGAWCFRID